MTYKMLNDAAMADGGMSYTLNDPARMDRLPESVRNAVTRYETQVGVAAAVVNADRSGRPWRICDFRRVAVVVADSERDVYEAADAAGVPVGYVYRVIAGLKDRA